MTEVDLKGLSFDSKEPLDNSIVPVRPERSEAKSKDALSHRKTEFEPESIRGS